MTAPSSFHVRHDLQPQFTYELLALLYSLPMGQSEESLRQQAEEQGFSLRLRKDYSKIISSLDDLDLVERSNKTLLLTPIGRTIAEIGIYQRTLLPELIHFLYMTAYETNPLLRWSWSYREVCNWLWMSAPCPLKGDKLVNIVSQLASSAFEEESISFSTQSVMGITNWLSALRPPCLDADKVFSRRITCPIELFVLALHHVYEQQRQGALSLLITPNLRQDVCRICLITPEAFSELLEQTEAVFDCVEVRHERGERLAIAGFNWESLKE